jgi:hypothetical protein
VKNGTTVASATEPVASRASSVSESGISTIVAAITGDIDDAGDGPPSHDTTAAIASNPGRTRTNSVASSGIGISGSTSCVRAIVAARPP